MKLTTKDILFIMALIITHDWGTKIAAAIF